MSLIILFAKLLKKQDLYSKRHGEFADIIISESERLSLLSSNRLKLSTRDSKTILAHWTRFSLDEEIRKVILILDPQWTRKEIVLYVELSDIIMEGDRQLLQKSG